MEATNNAKLGMMAQLVRKLREENARLREENAQLRGQYTEAQRIFDEQDMEVFRLARGEVKSDCPATVIIINK